MFVIQIPTVFSPPFFKPTILFKLQVDDIFDDGSCHSQQRFQPINSVTQVYRAETSTPSQQQQQLLRPQQQQHQRPTTLLPPPLEKSEILLGAILRTSERNRHLESESDSIRVETSSGLESRRNYDDGLNRVTTPKGFNYQVIFLCFFYFSKSFLW